MYECIYILDTIIFMGVNFRTVYYIYGIILSVRWHIHTNFLGETPPPLRVNQLVTKNNSAQVRFVKVAKKGEIIAGLKTRP